MGYPLWFGWPTGNYPNLVQLGVIPISFSLGRSQFGSTWSDPNFVEHGVIPIWFNLGLYQFLSPWVIQILVNLGWPQFWSTWVSHMGVWKVWKYSSNYDIFLCHPYQTSYHLMWHSVHILTHGSKLATQRGWPKYQ